MTELFERDLSVQNRKEQSKTLREVSRFERIYCRIRTGIIFGRKWFQYVRKSVGNALRDISKKFPDFIRKEVETWSLDSKEIKQVYHLASKLIKKK